MNKEGQTDKLVLFRQAATSMSAGIILAAVSLTPTMSYMGFLFALVSLPLVIAAGLQIRSKASKFCDKVRIFGESLTFSFILISILSIILKWAQILGASAAVTTGATPNFIQAFFKDIPPIFVFVFCLILVVVLFSDIKVINHRIGFRQTAVRFILVAAFLGGLYIVSSLPFHYSIALVPKIILLVIWGIFIPLCLYYLSSTTKNRSDEEIAETLEMIRL